MYPYDFQSPQMGQSPYPQPSMGQNPYGNQQMGSYGNQSYSGQQAGHAPYNFPMDNPQGMLPQPQVGTLSSPYNNGYQNNTQNNMQQARYARGGSARPRNMHSLADALRSKGQGGDSVLAHISPEEARMLGQQQGYDINPHTGLPQYGFFKKIFRKGPLKKLLPIIGTVVGSALGGPAGGAIGGAIGGGLTNKNPLKGGVMGGAMGYAGGSLLGATGLTPATSSGFGGMFGGAGNAATGITGADKLAMSKAGFGHMDLAGMAKGKGGGAGFLGNLFGGGSGGGSGAGGFLGNLLGGGGGGGLMNNILPLAMMGGMLGGKQKIPKEPDFQDQLHNAGAPPRDNRPLPPAAPFGMTNNPHAPQWDPLANAYEGEQNLYQQPDPRRYYARGGHLDGDTDGQADKIDAKLSDGEFVIRADVVSDLGDGNNKSGAKKLYDFMHNISKHKRTKKTGLPPKAKSIEHYMRSKGGKRHAV